MFCSLGLHCFSGQTYQSCGDSCTRSCRDIALFNGTCHSSCAEGCNCPEGFTLNSKNQCIPVSKCPCNYQNIEYKAGQDIIMESSEGPKFW